MRSVFWVQWLKEKRAPFLVLAFLGLSIVLTLLFGANIESKQRIGVFYDTSMDSTAAEMWIERMNQNETYEFFHQDETKARKTVREGRADVAVHLMTNDFRIIAVMENYIVQLVEHHVQSVFAEELLLREATEMAIDADVFRKQVAHYMESPPINVSLQSPEGSELAGHNMGTQLLFAFTLFLAMFTIGMKINQITTEKVKGIWNRVILSPLSKSQQYMGHLFYSSLIGFIQILAVLAIFRYGFGFELGERLDLLLIVVALYTVATVALTILFAGIIRTPEGFLMIFPSIVPIIPLISGAYMPPGTITNSVLLTIAKLFPLSHAMDAMLNIAQHHTGWIDMSASLAKMLLIAVVCMGVGMNLLERRRA